jgi:thiol-disulfide isomerase/thioredoxin
MIIRHLTEETFADAIREPGLAVIDFWAGWCGPVAAQAGVIGAERLVEALDRLAAAPAKEAA